MIRSILGVLVLVVVLAVSLGPLAAAADPCGMVPPIYTGQGVPITRVGPQRTYVFYKDGMETYVIRPGFQGKVEEFGMLIPFPSVPALRKVPDEIFAQLAAAVDPPEVVIDLSPQRFYEDMAKGAAMPSSAAAEAPLQYDEVKVLKREAVGMYEVAILAAGSAGALKRWMDEHGFKYPTGMDAVCNDYVKLGWVFVAEKTRVGSKPNSDPKPGMRKVDAGIPAGSSFDGYVQGMGFRYKVDRPSVPMRLSPFNEGEKRQIVYFLTDAPVKFDGVDGSLVKRQLGGGRLRRNVTKPLPLRIIGGDRSAVTKDMLASVASQRDPKPHNGHARALFASDLLALKSGKLSLDHEEKEKELLRIGEALDLRGPQLDLLHEAELAVERGSAADGALSGLDGMALTVIDGEFPLEYMKTHDLTVSRFTMPPGQNGPVHYDAKNDGPGYQPGGFLWAAP